MRYDIPAEVLVKIAEALSKKSVFGLPQGATIVPQPEQGSLRFEFSSGEVIIVGVTQDTENFYFQLPLNKEGVIVQEVLFNKV